MSIFLISSLIAAIGLTSNWYTNTIQSQLINNNFSTARLVEQIASIERGLFQSLVFLISIKEVEAIPEESVTMDQPNSEILSGNYYSELEKVQNSIVSVKSIILSLESMSEQEKAIIYEIEERFNFYRSISREWLDLREEGQFDEMFTTSISPYFINNLMPTVEELREKAVTTQGEQNLLLEEQLEQADLAIFLLTSVFILLSVSIAFYLYRSIANPLMLLNASANKLGEGMLTERISISGNDEIAELGKSFNRMASNLEKRTLARDYLDSIIESIHEALLVTDAEGIIVGLNKSTQNMLHYTREELIGIPISMIYDFETMKGEYDRNLNTQDSFEFSFVSKRGRKIPVLFSESKLINNKEEEVGSVVVATDITQRKRANEKIRESLREKEVLLAEIHHRVKNNLAVISGILQLQTYSTGEKKVIKALQESQSRIQSISLVHEMLYQSETLAYIEYDKYVRDLIQAISSMYEGGNSNIVITADVESFSLNLNTAIPCSLLLNEIILNSYKHAFVNKKGGAIHVIMKKTNDEVTMVVQDNGIGISTEDLDQKNSLGLKLIKTLTSQLNGSYNISNLEDNTGTKTEVRFLNETD
ncbi:MAG: PAS domain S-box protein [Balneolales bacterium]|nr:PAS domain S-box protein [Balneolales bacterium]